MRVFLLGRGARLPLSVPKALACQELGKPEERLAHLAAVDIDFTSTLHTVPILRQNLLGNEMLPSILPQPCVYLPIYIDCKYMLTTVSRVDSHLLLPGTRSLLLDSRLQTLTNIVDSCFSFPSIDRNHTTYTTPVALFAQDWLRHKADALQPESQHLSGPVRPTSRLHAFASLPDQSSAPCLESTLDMTDWTRVAVSNRPSIAIVSRYTDLQHTLCLNMRMPSASSSAAMLELWSAIQVAKP